MNFRFSNLPLCNLDPNFNICFCIYYLRQKLVCKLMKKEDIFLLMIITQSPGASFLFNEISLALQFPVFHITTTNSYERKHRVDHPNARLVCFFLFLHYPLCRYGCEGSSLRLSRLTSRSSITYSISLG